VNIRQIALVQRCHQADSGCSPYGLQPRANDGRTFHYSFLGKSCQRSASYPVSGLELGRQTNHFCGKVAI
jgi:hypothetical protein